MTQINKYLGIEETRITSIMEIDFTRPLTDDEGAMITNMMFDMTLHNKVDLSDYVIEDDPSYQELAISVMERFGEVIIECTDEWVTEGIKMKVMSEFGITLR